MRVFLTIAFLLISLHAAGPAQLSVPQQTQCARSLPPGLVIRVKPDEKIVAGKTDGPLLLTVTADVRLFPAQPPIVPRFSKVFAQVVESQDAGRQSGRARYRMIMSSILTPNECAYKIEAQLTEAGKFKVTEDTVVGDGHAKRDMFAFLFPPTTVYQLIRTPALGPKLVFDDQTTLSIRLLESVYLLEPANALDTIASGYEAPKSFQSQNGLLSAKQFDESRKAFEEVETPATGLGIHFNESSCAGCHVAGGEQRLPGGSSRTTVLRAGHYGRNNKFIPAPGGTLITTRAVGDATPEVKALPDSENIRDRFITLSLFGTGFVESVADDTLRRIAAEQAKHSAGRIRGFVREVPILEAPGKTGVGRFGWAAQHASLLSFSADAYKNEMGITSPLQPNDNTLLGEPADDGIPDPEDTGGKFGEDVELFTSFMRALSAPARLLPSAQKEREEIDEGSKTFEAIGCTACHLPELVTADTGEWLNGRTFRVPKALGNKRFHPYGDFLLHDIGTGPNILREGMPPEAKGKIRTAALWGLGTRQANGEPLLHDGSALTLENAIQRHRNSAAPETEKFQRLHEKEKAKLLKFLRSL
jgi:CxxC motif-containing protein (DUF1111 family)